MGCGGKEMQLCLTVTLKRVDTSRWPRSRRLGGRKRAAALKGDVSDEGQRIACFHLSGNEASGGARRHAVPFHGIPWDGTHQENPPDAPYKDRPACEGLRG